MFSYVFRSSLLSCLFPRGLAPLLKLRSCLAPSTLEHFAVVYGTSELFSICKWRASKQQSEHPNRKIPQMQDEVNGRESTVAEIISTILITSQRLVFLYFYFFSFLFWISVVEMKDIRGQWKVRRVKIFINRERKRHGSQYLLMLTTGEHRCGNDMSLT